MREEQRNIGGVASTKCPRFDLIPLEALEGLADRFEQGVERKGDKAWNATTSNQECLVNKDFLLDRISHVIHHAMKLRDQLVRGVQIGEESMYENAGAVAFGGALFLCAAKKLEKDEVEWPSGHGSPEYDASPLLRDIVDVPPMNKVKEYGVDWSLKAGRCYLTVGLEETGTLIEFNPVRAHIEGKPRQFFSKLRSDVVWLWDGTPLKVNMSLTDAGVEKFRIAYGAVGSMG